MPFKISSDLIVNQVLAGTQTNGTAAALINGNYVVAFSDFSTFDLGHTAIKLRIISPENQAVTQEIIVSTTKTAVNDAPSVATLADGRFVVVWVSDADGDASGRPHVEYRIFNPDGQPDTAVRKLSTIELDTISYPRVNPTSDGGFVVSWEGREYVHFTDLPYVRMFDAKGVAIGNDFAAPTSSQVQSYLPSTAGLQNGHIAVAWTELDTKVSFNFLIKAQLLTHDGESMSEPFEVGAKNNNPDLSVLAHSPVVSALSNGGWVACWWQETHNRNDSSINEQGIRFRVFDGNGSARSAELSIQTAESHQPGAQIHKVCGLADGRFAIFWESPTSLVAEVFQADGTSCGEQIEIGVGMSGGFNTPSISMLAKGGFAVTWDVNKGDGIETNVHTAVVGLDEFSGTAVGDRWKGGSFAEVLLGRGGADYLCGFGGNDRIYGGSGDDNLFGGSGSDKISGGSGGDRIVGGNGADKIDGGTGADKYVYMSGDQCGDNIVQFDLSDSFAFKSTKFGFDHQGAVDEAEFLSRASGHAAHNTRDRFIFDEKLDQLWFDVDGNGAKKALLVADMKTDCVVTAQDILII